MLILVSGSQLNKKQQYMIAFVQTLYLSQPNIMYYDVSISIRDLRQKNK